jgi:hypothetical protein
MYTVTYSYYNYPIQSKTFDSYSAARGFQQRIQRSTGVRRSELIVPEPVQ